MTTEQQLENIGDPVYTDNNPLKKLMEGFCRPKKVTTKASNLNDDDDDVDNNYYYAADKYAPDLAPSQTQHNHEEEKGYPSPELSTPVKVGMNPNSSKIISELTTDASTTRDHMNTDSTSNTMSPSPISLCATTATTKQENQPGIEVSKRVTMMRRKRGIENVIMACIFVLTTLLTLKKIGFTTSDFDFIIVGGGDDDNNGSSSTSKSWIQIFDKELTIERGKIGVKKIASVAKLIDEIEEANDENDEEDDIKEDDDESSYEYNGNDGDDDDYNTESSCEVGDEL